MIVDMKNITPIVIVLVIALGAGYLLMSKTTPPITEAKPEVAQVETKQAFVADKTFNVKGLDYSYDVKEIKVKLNDKVKINFTNTEGFHDLKIDELGVATKQIKVNESESVEFVANKAGSFQYYCSVGQHRANGMWGTIIVE